MPKEIVFAKQPILNREEKIEGYELLFRQKVDVNSLQADRYATSVLLSAFLSAGYKQVLGNNRGFVNVDELFIKSGSLDILPKDDFVIEVLEDVEILYVSERLEKYKKEGYILALDDFVANRENFDKYMEFFYLFNIVKFDIQDDGLDESMVEMCVHALKQFGITVLAEKVETKEQYEKYKNMGFDLFQGYFFLKPQESSQKTLQPNKRILLELWSLGDDEFEKIVEKLRENPELSFMIIKLVNSSIFALKKEISSVREALVYLGLRNFKKWILLILYAQDEEDITSNPKINLAKNRANFLTVAAKILGLDEDKAYLTGVLSLLEELFGATKEEIQKQLPFVDKEVVEALTGSKNVYGRLLYIVQRIEHGDFTSWEDIAKAIGKSSEEIAAIYSEALMM